MNRTDFIEGVLFNKYKDEILHNSEYFKFLIKDYKDVNKENLYRKIVNYQVEKYGEQLYQRGKKIGRDYENLNKDFTKKDKIEYWKYINW